MPQMTATGLEEFLLADRTKPAGRALKACPKCRGDLTAPGGLSLRANVLDTPVEAETNVCRETGHVRDCGRVIFNGYPHRLACRKCGADLGAHVARWRVTKYKA